MNLGQINLALTLEFCVVVGTHPNQTFQVSKDENLIFASDVFFHSALSIESSAQLPFFWMSQFKVNGQII